MTIVTMQCDDNAPVSWSADESFSMERATSILAIGRDEWPETTPRTERPARFFWGAIPLTYSRPVLWAYTYTR